jgi:ATP-dependent protease HslVU (ClpYQ) peptidase subunit
MSTIVAVVENEIVSMGADSLYQNRSTRITGNNAKIAKLSQMVIGVTGSGRVADTLFYESYAQEIENTLPNFLSFKPTTATVALDINTQFSSYLRCTFVPFLQKTLSRYNLLKHENEEPEMDADIIIGYNGQIYEICCNLSVIDCENWGHAIGSGDDVARGVLYSYEFDEKPRRVKLYAEDKILMALKAAEYLTTGTRRPFYLISENTDEVKLLDA